MPPDSIIKKPVASAKDRGEVNGKFPAFRGYGESHRAFHGFAIVVSVLPRRLGALSRIDQIDVYLVAHLHRYVPI